MTAPDARMAASETLFQLRTAYRFLHAYHRRLLDLATIARDSVKEHFGELPKAWWAPMNFSMPPRSNSDPTVRWAYDFICLQNVSFNWASTESPAHGGFFFGIGHVGDTSIGSNYDQEPDPLQLPDVRQSETYLEVYTAATMPSAITSWPAFVTTHFGEEYGEWLRSEDRKVHEWDEGGDVVRVAGFSVDVEDVWTTEQLRMHLVEPLVKLIGDVQNALPSGGERRTRKARRS